MFRTALLAAAILWPVAASAQSAPPEVMAHYRVYAAEMRKADPDREVLTEAAYDAWQEAEDRLGSSRLTGDLAINFAESGGMTVRGEFIDLNDAYARSAELARYYPEGERMNVTADRRLLQAQNALNRYTQRTTLRDVRKILDRLRRDLRDAGMGDSTYVGDLETLFTQASIREGKNKTALKHADLAHAAYARANDDLPSLIRFQLPLFEAIAAQELGQHIRAGRTLQKLVEDHYELTGQYTGPSAGAYSRWLELRDDIRDRADEPEIAELLAWTPPAASGTDEPAIRIPPVMPPSARSSGWVDLEFDIQPDGRIAADTVEVADSSGATFERSAKSSLEKWVYPPGMPEGARKGVTTRITFQLRRPNGSIMPPSREPPSQDR